MSFLGFLADYWEWIIPGTLAIIGLLVVAYLTRSWQLVVGAGAVFAALATVGRAYSKGSDSAVARQKLATAKAVEAVHKTKTEIATMSDNEVENELSKWVKR